MTKILLISEDYVKTNSCLTNNVWGEYLLPAIRESQDIELQSIVGECLYKRILEMVDDGSIRDEGNVMYKDLLDDYIQPYLLYRTQIRILPIINVRMANIGSVMTNDEHIQNLSAADAERLSQEWETTSNHYQKQMQCFLKNNREAFKELDCSCNCCQIKPNLSSAESSPIWLGGLRGRRFVK